MKTKVEGILLRKVPYQDRHIIGTLLLRSGRVITVLFYGGQGGGKKLKSSQLELGYLISTELGHSRSTQNMQNAKEWTPGWVHESIRLNHKAFSLMCLFLEIVTNLAPEENLHDENSDYDESMMGLFKVLSNGLFHLEKRAKEKKCDPHSELIIFLGKLLVEQGVFPTRENCAFCDEILFERGDVFLVTDHGGFSCGSCLTHLEEAITTNQKEGRELWELLGVVANHRYQELSELKIEYNEVAHILFHYFCYQFHFKAGDFKSLSMVL